jgi:ribosomal protein S18 acetylase RimI-like enzyme
LRQELVCDVAEPWAHGTVLRATQLPDYWDFNLVRVEDDPDMSAESLMAVADEALDGLAHRRFDFDLIGPADRLRPAFRDAGWESTRLVWMQHSSPPPPGPSIEVETVPYDAVDHLRAAWHQEDFPNIDPTDYLEQSNEVNQAREVQVLAARGDDGAAIAFAQLQRGDGIAEVTHVYVLPEHRGGGRGTAVTRAAIEAASDVDHLLIVADDEDRPKELYARLGFAPIWMTMEMTRLPSG